MSASTPTGKDSAPLSSSSQAQEMTTIQALQRLRCPHCHDPLNLGDSDTEDVLCPSCGGSFRIQDTQYTNTLSPMTKLGKFQLLERVGVGGFGAVWKARDTELDRTVALKLPNPGLMSSAEGRERFQREARAAAQLHHPGIVTVHEVVTLDAAPAIVSEFVEGVTLRELLQLRALTFRETALLIAELADALEYAHSMGLIHRDVKPGNVMIEEGDARAKNGRYHVRLMDFGLALRDDVETTMTVEGQILGTPAYMSPEQAAGHGHRVDCRTDVYSLGVMLYELLTGQRPFNGSRVMIVYQVIREEPRPPRRLNDKVPRDLETICLKALAKNPRQRYATARELADELRRWLNGEPILASPVGAAGRLWRWCRRNPLVASLSATALLLLLAVAIVASVGYGLTSAALGREEFQRKVAERQEKEARAAEKREALERKEAERQRDVADRLLYQARLRLAGEVWAAGDVESELPTLLRGGEPIPGQADYRGWEWYHLRAHLSRHRHTLRGHRGAVNAVAFSPDGRRLASGAQDDFVRLWNSETPPTTVALSAEGRWNHRTVAWSPDGTRLAVDDGNRGMRIWDTHKHTIVARIPRQESFVSAADWSPDNRHVAFATYKTVSLWDVAGSRIARAFPAQSESVTTLCWSRDGKWIAGAVALGFVKVWETDTGNEVCTLHIDLMAGKHRINGIGFHPDGKQLVAVVGGLAKLFLWDVPSGRTVATIAGVRPGAKGLSWSPDGKRLATCHDDGTVQVWNMTGRKESFTMRCHARPINALSWSADGRLLATASDDRTIRLWNIDEGDAAGFTIPRSADSHLVAGNPIRDVLWKPDGSQLAMASSDHTVRVWDVASGKVSEVLKDNGGWYPQALAWMPNGEAFVRVTANSFTELCDSRSGALLRRIEIAPGGVSAIAVNHDGTLAASTLNNPRPDRLLPGLIVHIWEVRSGKTQRTLRGHTDLIWRLAFAPTDSRVATASADRTVGIWDATTGQQLHELKGHSDEVRCVAWSPDGKRLVTAGADQTVRIWDAASGKELSVLRGHSDEVWSLCISPDGSRIASGSREVKLWDMIAGQEIMTLRWGISHVLALAWSPDGRRLAVAPGGNDVMIWDAGSDFKPATP